VSSISALLKRHPLAAFFGLAYGISWILWSPWLYPDRFSVCPVPGRWTRGTGLARVCLAPLQARTNALISSLILGVFWAFWHFPLFFAPASSQSANSLPFLWYMLHTVAITVVFTWLFNSTGGSVLLPMLLHAGLNAIASWVPLRATGGAISLFVSLVLVEWLIAIVLSVVYGPARLSRQQTSRTQSSL